MIITLAGHVDHGKTTLVRALTGVDTDRLAEEKARGLTIDLGFAYTEQLGFVDVPGHQKFIHNMVAGVAADQHALLVIAADDGPMPQSREHLEILSLIGVKSGTIALTKCDLVSNERLAKCRDEITALVQNTMLETADVFQTSVQDSSSYLALSQHLQDLAEEHQPKSDEARFRLAVDRAFTVKGAGVVVTGTVHSGSLKSEQLVEHFPSGKSLRVRSMRVEDQLAEETKTGDRCALNLVGASLDEVKRGDWITDHAVSGHRSITIRLDQASSFARDVKHWMPVHVYHATSHSTGRLALFTDAPNHETWAEIVCDTPMACCRGDRVVLRDQALDTTLGGGEVLYLNPSQVRRRNAPEHRRMVSAYAAVNAQECFKRAMYQLQLNLEAFQQIWNLPDHAIQALSAENDVTSVNDIALSEKQWAQIQQECLEQFIHDDPKANNLGAGIKAQDIKSVPQALRQSALDALLKSGAIVQQGALYRLPELEPTLPAELLSLWEQVEPLLDHMQAPSCGDLAKMLNLNLQHLEKQLMALSKAGKLTFLGNHRFYLPRRLGEIASVVEEMTQQDPTGQMTVKSFRDKTGIGRNVAIDVLEYFDSKGFTRRQGNERVVLRVFNDL